MRDCGRSWTSATRPGSASRRDREWRTDKSGIVTPDFVRLVRREFALDWNGIHCARHWARVRANGLRLAEVNGADTRVVEYFAFLHDVKRDNDGHDPAHGARAVRLAESLRGGPVQLEDGESDMLCDACRYHSDGRTEAPVTVQTCWDADRLDLGRVGIRPDPRRLCTEEGKAPEIIEWAYDGAWRIDQFEIV